MPEKYNSLSGPANQAVNSTNINDNGGTTLSVTVGTGATMTFDASGNRVVCSPNGSVVVYAQRNTGSDGIFDNGNDTVTYLLVRYPSSVPSTNQFLIRWQSGGSALERLYVDNAGVAKLESAGWTSPTALVPDRNYIFGVRILLSGSATGGKVQVRRWDAPAGSPNAIPDITATADYTSSEITRATGTAFDVIRIGNTAANNAGSVQIGEFRIKDGGWKQATQVVVTPTQNTADVVMGQTATLTATATPDGGTWSWARHPSDPGNAPAITLSGASTNTATYTAPTSASGTTARWVGTYTLGAQTVTTTQTRNHILPGQPVVQATRTDQTVINATASSGTVRLERISGPELTVVESPSKVFTITSTNLAENVTYHVFVRDGFGQDSEPLVVVIGPSEGGGTQAGTSKVSHWTGTAWSAV